MSANEPILPERYDPAQIEGRWQAVWQERSAFHAEPVSRDGQTPELPDEDKAYVAEMLPYPSGEIHMGHVKNYTMGDALAHFRRRNGARVFHPMGYDAFGLPAENAAIRTGVHPAISTRENIARIREQLKGLGFAIDWDTELSTADPGYYRWTQWLFLRFWEKGLAERRDASVNWCPEDQTVLANEQVVDGRCDRCGSEIEPRQLTQWFLRITDYAQDLLDEMDLLEDWPERVLTMQRNWIGRSEGARVVFIADDDETEIPVFTTRPDTLFGATFFLLAPEHPLIDDLVDGRPEAAAVAEYVRASGRLDALERGAPDKPKTGAFTGRYVTNPVNGEQLPIWVADYVLMDYGTGAVMAVPAHDQRDFEFAAAHDLPVRQVIGSDGEGAADEAWAGEGTLINSGFLDGLDIPAAKEAITAHLAREGMGETAIDYRLRDWLISRQRYWGAPIPIIHCPDCGEVPVADEDLPVVLPDIDDYVPQGQSPLAAAEDWVNVECPMCGEPARRETDTMDTFVDSSWYLFRYTAPRYTEGPFERDIVDYWFPIDQYIGGVEHAVLHLLYARFFTKVLNDLDLVGFREPFARLFTQGMIYRDGAKMSKSRGNVVAPDDIVSRFGADTLRLYVLFMGPAADDIEWNDQGVEGQRRFLDRAWRLVSGQPAGPLVERPGLDQLGDDVAARGLVRKAEATIAKVSEDVGERFSFHTAIAALQELVNLATKGTSEGVLGTPEGVVASRYASQVTTSLLFPFAPHVACEMWEALGGEDLWRHAWPEADADHLVSESVTIAVQVNGKLRGTFEAATDASDAAIEAEALELPKVVAARAEGEVRKVIVVPGRLVNIVIA